MPKKSQTELFDVQETTDTTPLIPPKKKTKKDMSAEQKKILVDRLKLGRERKRREREGLEPIVEEETSVPVERPTTHFVPNPQTAQKPKSTIPSSDNEKDALKQQISELRSEIKQTKEKAELDAMKQELKELRESMSTINKKKSNDIVNTQNVKVIQSPKSVPQKPVAPPPAPNPPRVVPVVPSVLKKRFK